MSESLFSFHVKNITKNVRKKGGFSNRVGVEAFGLGHDSGVVHWAANSSFERQNN